MDDTLNGMDRIEDRNLNDAVMKAIELIMAGQAPGETIHLAAKPCHLSESEIAYYVGQWSGSLKARKELQSTAAPAHPLQQKQRNLILKH